MVNPTNNRNCLTRRIFALLGCFALVASIFIVPCLAIQNNPNDVSVPTVPTYDSSKRTLDYDEVNGVRMHIANGDWYAVYKFAYGGYIRNFYSAISDFRQNSVGQAFTGQSTVTTTSIFAINRQTLADDYIGEQLTTSVRQTLSSTAVTITGLQFICKSPFVVMPTYDELTQGYENRAVIDISMSSGVTFDVVIEYTFLGNNVRHTATYSETASHLTVTYDEIIANSDLTTGTTVPIIVHNAYITARTNNYNFNVKIPYRYVAENSYVNGRIVYNNTLDFQNHDNFTLDSIINAVGGVFSAPIFGVFGIGSLLVVLLSISLVVAIVNMVKG